MGCAEFVGFLCQKRCKKGQKTKDCCKSIDVRESLWCNHTQTEIAPYLRLQSKGALFHILNRLQTKVKIRCGLQCKPLDKPNLPKMENIRQAFSLSVKILVGTLIFPC